MSETAPFNLKTLPIVGSYFRPPAKTICENLSLNTRLTLIAEPTNPFDEFAIAVWLDVDDMSNETMIAIEPLLPSAGHSVESLCEMQNIHLGYIPKELAKVLRQRGFESAEGVFKTSAKGSPMIEFLDPSKKREETTTEN